MKRAVGFFILVVLLIPSLVITGCRVSPEPSTTSNTSSISTENTTTSKTVIDINSIETGNFSVEDGITDAEIAAGDFVRDSSTFQFDGIPGSIKLLKTDAGFTSAYRSWAYIFEFQTAHPGHGARTGQFLADVITTHNAMILVRLEPNIAVIMATCDSTWDMINEKDLPVSVSGIVVSGGDTTPPGLLDAPRVYVYKILNDEGFFQNISYIGYPPSPAGDAAAAKITLDFYDGSIRIGDKLDARGTLNKESNTIVVAEQGDYIRTSLHKATVVGVVISITGIGANDNSSLSEFSCELLREDGTYVNVSYIPNGESGISLYGETIEVGEFMKAIGTYDKKTNTVALSGIDDSIQGRRN